MCEMVGTCFQTTAAVPPPTSVFLSAFNDRKTNAFAGAGTKRPAPERVTSLPTRNVQSYAEAVNQPSPPPPVKRTHQAFDSGAAKGADFMQQRAKSFANCNHRATDTKDVDMEAVPPPPGIRCEFNLNTKEGRNAVKTLLPTKIQLRLEQPFGEDDANHSFADEATLRHVLLPLLFGDFLEGRHWDRLCNLNIWAAQLRSLLKQCGSVDFRPLRTMHLPPNWDEATDFNDERLAMFTACALFCQGDMASATRFTGGPAVGSHCNVDEILRDIAPHASSAACQQARRPCTEGAPTHCKASSADRSARESG